MTIFRKKLLFNKANRFYLSLLICITFLPSVFAQKAITLTEYLESTFNSSNIKSDSKGLSFFENYNYNLPLINSIDLRSETRDFLLNQQEYSLRINPNSLKAISLQKKIYENKLEKVKIDAELNFNEELKKRYLLILDYHFTNEITKLGKKRRRLQKDKLKILSKSIYNTNFDIKDLIESENELLSIELKLSNLKDVGDAQKYLLKRFLNFYGDSLVFDFENLISAEKIITERQGSSIKSDVEIASQKLKLTTLRNEMALDKAKSNQILDFFQAKYESSSNINFNENFSIGMGLNIPFFGNNRKKQGDYYFEKLSEEAQLRTLEETVKDERLFAGNEFKNAILNYQVINSQLEGSSVSSILNSYKKMEGVSPIVLINLISLQSKKELEVLQSKHKLYKKYIEVLAAKGVLFQKPLRNLLSTNKEYVIN